MPGFDTAAIEISTPRDGGRNSGITVHRLSAPLRTTEWTRVAGIPTTRPARTLIDLAGVVPPARLEDTLRRAIRRRLVHLDELSGLLSAPEALRRRGTKTLRAFVTERRGQSGAASESVLETHLIRLLKRARLPMPLQQYTVTLDGGGRARIDFAYPHLMLAIEADGYRWHSGKQRWASDLDRRNALTTAGWRVLHLTWDDVERDPVGTVQRIAQLIEAPAPVIEGLVAPGPRAH